MSDWYTAWWLQPASPAQPTAQPEPECPTCGKKFRTQPGLATHTRIKHGESD